MPESSLRTIQPAGYPRSFPSGLIPLLLALLWLAAGEAVAQPPRLDADTEIATAGYYSLNWKAAGRGAVFELQEAGSAGFAEGEARYIGPDTAIQLSGLSDGDYFYRVRVIEPRSEATGWSEVVQVQVEHHPLSRALIFFTVGLIVFLATVILIVRGSKSVK